MSSRHVWDLLAWGSWPVWHTSKSAGLVISITEPVEAAALLGEGGGGAEDMARRCSSGCSGCRVRLHRSMAAGVRALSKDAIVKLMRGGGASRGGASISGSTWVLRWEPSSNMKAIR